MSASRSRVCPECGAALAVAHGRGCVFATAWPVAEAGTSARVECLRRGWVVADVPGEGLRPCHPDEPGAYLDLDRHAFWAEHGDDAIHGADGPP